MDSDKRGEMSQALHFVISGVRRGRRPDVVYSSEVEIFFQAVDLMTDD